MNALHHGKVKTVWETEDQWKILIEHHDKVTAHNGLKKDFPEGKGAICCTISSFLPCCIPRGLHMAHVHGNKHNGIQPQWIQLQPEYLRC